MHMIRRAADAECGRLAGAEDGGEVWIEFRFNFGCDEPSAVLGGKDNMDEDAGEGLRHGPTSIGMTIDCAPLGLHFLRDSSPRAALRLPWAFLFGPFGAFSDGGRRQLLFGTAHWGQEAMAHRGMLQIIIASGFSNAAFSSIRNFAPSAPSTTR